MFNPESKEQSLRAMTAITAVVGGNKSMQWEGETRSCSSAPESCQRGGF